MCSPAPPAPPDPNTVASAQTQSNIATANANAQLNRVNQYTPYGNLTYSQTPGQDGGESQWNQNVSLSPQEQQIFNNQTSGQINLGNIALGMQNQVGGSYANPINSGGGPGIVSHVNGSGPGITGQVPGQQDMGKAIQDAQDAAYKGQTQYLDPQYEIAGKSLDNSLINQGITQGSEADTNARTMFNNQKQQAYGNAQMQAVQAGQNEQNVLFGQGVSSANLQNQANQQSFGQAQSNADLQNSAQNQYLQQLFALRNQPLNEYNALMTGAQVQSPTFQNVPTANRATTDVAGIYNQGYQNQMSQYQAQQAGINNLFSLGGSLGGAAIMASDRRLKRDVLRVGETTSGIPIYEYAYIWDGADIGRHVGVMADEVAHIPEAVFYDDDGFAMVDYARIK